MCRVVGSLCVENDKKYNPRRLKDQNGLVIFQFVVWLLLAHVFSFIVIIVSLRTLHAHTHTLTHTVTHTQHLCISEIVHNMKLQKRAQHGV